MKRLRGYFLLLLVAMVCAPAFAAGDGEQMLEDFVKQKALIDDEKLVAYVRAVGMRVAAHSGYPVQSLHFNIVDDASVNAFATGDGYIFVHRGLLAYLDREDQLAGVLGHEIGHVTRRHIAQQKSDVFWNRAAAIAASLVTLNSGIGDVIAAYGAERISGFGREHELEADHEGARYMIAAGYDPQAMIEVVQILKDQEVFAKRVTGQNVTYHALFASHPRNDQRLQQAVSSVGTLASEAVEPVDDYLARVEGLTWGNAGAAGAVRGQLYYHGRLGFVLEAPPGWRLADSPSKLMMYMPGGATQGFISMELDAAKEGYSAEDIITKVLKPGPLKNGMTRTIKDGERELAAYSATLDAAAGALGTSAIAVVIKDGRAHIFRADTREATAIDALRAGLTFAMEHLRTITYADLKVANTERIALYEAQPGDTYDALAKSTPIPANGANELRLLNGDFPNGEPRAGDRIKLVK